MSDAADDVRDAWVTAAVSTGGDRGVANDTANELLASYEQTGRHYHGVAHIRDVLARIAELRESVRLADDEGAAVVLAACAHDVVYAGQAGEDERASAMWAGESLLRAGIAPAVIARAQALVLVTTDHVAPPEDDAAAVLVDADLAVLGSAQRDYDAYVAAVRAEYAHVSDDDWRRGRAGVLRDLLAREPLYLTEAGRQHWETAARENLNRELAALGG